MIQMTPLLAFITALLTRTTTPIYPPTRTTIPCLFHRPPRRHSRVFPPFLVLVTATASVHPCHHPQNHSNPLQVRPKETTFHPATFLHLEIYNPHHENEEFATHLSFTWMIKAQMLVYPSVDTQPPRTDRGELVPESFLQNPPRKSWRPPSSPTFAMRVTIPYGKRMTNHFKKIAIVTRRKNTILP